MIEDINNYPPQFDPTNYTAFVQRYYHYGQYPPVEVVQVVAVDLDQAGTVNAQIVYELVSHEATLFSINNETGVITVTNELSNVG